MLPGITGMLAGVAGAPVGTIYIEDEQLDDVDASTFSFSIDGHEADEGRRIFIPIHHIEGASHQTVTGVTINGETASIRQRGHNGGITGLGAAIAHAAVPTTDGTMTVEVTFSGEVNVCVISAVVTYGFASSATDFDTDESTVSADDVVGSVDVAEGGFVLAVYTGSTNADGAAVSWTGAIEQYDFDTGEATSNRGRASMAFESGLSAESARTVRAAISGTANAGNDMVVESWGF